jgi:hypothetical protein
MLDASDFSTRRFVEVNRDVLHQGHHLLIYGLSGVALLSWVSSATGLYSTALLCSTFRPGKLFRSWEWM